MDLLKKQLTTLKRQVTKIDNWFQTNKNNDDSYAFQLKRELLQGYYEKFTVLLENLDTIEEDVSSDSFQKDCDELENKYCNVLIGLRRRIDELKIVVVPTHVKDQSEPTNPTVFNTKLPEISINTFTGEFSDWNSFYELYENLILKNNSLSDVQKFIYLKSYLQGEPLNLISSLQLTAGNFQIALNTLKDRYENQFRIVNAHIKKLLDVSVLNKTSPSEIRQFIIQSKQSIQSLTNLGVPKEEWADLILIHIYIQKLDYNTNKSFESERDPKKRPVLEDFFGFLDRRCSVMETVSENFPPTNSNNKRSTPSPRPSSKGTTYHTNLQTSSNSKNNSIICSYCSVNNHRISQCNKFKIISPQQRFDFVKQKRLCRNCLSCNHGFDSCMSLKTCLLCNKRHHTLLHNPNFQSGLQRSNNFQGQNRPSTSQNVNTFIPSTPTAPPLSNENQIHQETSSNSITTCSSVMRHSSETLLATALVNLYSSSGEKHTARALLDSGSQTSFISEQLLQKLNCRWYKRNFQINTIAQQVTHSHKMTDLNFYSIFEEKRKFSVSCIVLEHITSNLPRFKLDVSLLKLPDNIQLADPHFYESQPVDMLLGMDIYSELMCGGFKRLGVNLPVLVETHLGWTISGNMPSQLNSFHLLSKPNPNECQSPFSFLVRTPEERADKLIERFWTVEDITSSEPVASQDEMLAEKIFQDTTLRLCNGKFQVSLPLKGPEERTKLGESFARASKRFYTLENKLKKNPRLYDEYKKFIDEYIELGHAKEITLQIKDQNGNLKYYLPHHCVIREDAKTTKLRVVFDASMKTDTNFSLNDIMFKGPTVQPELFDILCRFRTFQFVFSADIEKMFRQIVVNPEHRTLQNILWRDSPVESLKCLELQTVTYGTNSAPYLSTRCLIELANTEETTYPLASIALKNQCYVDDILHGCESEADLLKAHQQLTDLLKSAGMSLHKWCSNSTGFLNSISSDNHSSKYVIREANHTNKVLGLIWNPSDDDLMITFPKSKETLRQQTKRQVLSTIAQVFDPMGLISPFVVIAKIIMQRIWLSKLDWDDQLPESLLLEWNDFSSSLKDLTKLIIPRNLFSYSKDSVIRIELHAFSDASMKCYGSCIYLRVCYNNNIVSCCLIAAKNRIAPLKQISLPRLELQGALLMANLTSKVRSIFSNSFSINAIHLWTDSEIVLAWIKAQPSRWTVFVANRVSEIQSKTADCQWHHIRSKDNPADILSRGSKPSDLIESDLWWHGPAFLRKDIAATIEEQHTVIENPPEERKTVLHLRCKENYFCDTVFSKYSSFNKVQRIMAYCLRFIANLKNQRTLEKKIGSLSLKELQLSEKIIVKIIQQRHFVREIQELSNLKSITNKSLKVLKPFLDEYGMIRVGGRLLHADIAYEHKHPLLVPSKTYIVRLLIKKEHLRLLHAGAQNVLANLRLKYWPIDGLREVKGVLRQCMTCFRVNPRPATQLMADLPKERLTVARAFTNVGIDFGGPFKLKPSNARSRVILKGYLAVFVCMTTKAVHLEAVSSLTTEDFLQALKRFVSRRGLPEVIFTDNGTNFQGANNKLKELFKFLKDDKNQQYIQSYLNNLQINWKFIPARSPHWGGIWEAAIKSTKYHTVRVIGETLLTYEQFSTVLAEIEAILNSRPLCPLTSDPTDLSCLTPGHFLIGAPLTALPEKDLSGIPENRLNRWARCIQIRQNFWKRWTVEYISNLQKRSKWLDKETNIEVGDLVLVMDELQPPLVWPIARVTEVFPGSDGKVRSVRVQTKKGIFTRSIAKLCPLPEQTQ